MVLLPVTLLRTASRLTLTRLRPSSSLSSVALARPAAATSWLSRPSSPTPTISHLARRAFQTSLVRRDVVFVSFPALKSILLTATRVTLVMLPFVWRWKLWHKYRRFSLALVQIPLFALCLIFALGLDQSPRTHRWRLLLMSEREEHLWSTRRSDELVEDDEDLLLGPADPRSVMVRRVLERLLEALKEEEKEVLNMREIVSVPGGWKPTHNSPQRRQRVGGGSEDEKAGSSTEAVGLAEEEEEGAGGVRSEEGYSLDTAYLVDLERKKDEEEAAAKYAALSKRAKRSRRRRHVEQEPVEDDEPENVISVRGWRVYLVDSPEINALALPTKQIFVYSGLVDLVEDDTLLAAVLGHEIAHAVERHAVENMGFLNVATVFFDVVRGISFALTLSFPVVTDSVALALNYINDVVAKRAYSRKLEMEADEVGLSLMARARYDPRAAHSLWELMDAVEHDALEAGQRTQSFQDKFELLRTHPLGVERQANVERLLPEAWTLFENAKRAKATLSSDAGPDTRSPALMDNVSRKAKAAAASDALVDSDG